MKPGLSIIITARNDNYGGNLINRMSAMLTVLSYLTATQRRAAELVIVEYNPPAGMPLLNEELTYPVSAYLTVRIIVVPERFHRTFANHSRIPLFEYIAKNIGIRRARGNFILSTNQDILFSEAMFLRLTHEAFDPNTFYRANRYDLACRQIDLSPPVPAILEHARKSAYCKWTANGKKLIGLSPMTLFSLSKDLLFNSILFFKGIHLSPPRLHEFAAGDFLLMHRDAWDDVRGYDEVPLSNYIDGYILYAAHCRGMQQRVLEEPIYHMAHSYAKRNRPSVDLETYRRNCEAMFQTGAIYKRNSPRWGAKGCSFSEIP